MEALGTASYSRQQIVQVDYQTRATQQTIFDPAVVMGGMSFHSRARRLAETTKPLAAKAFRYAGR